MKIDILWDTRHKELQLEANRVRRAMTMYLKIGNYECQGLKYPRKVII